MVTILAISAAICYAVAAALQHHVAAAAPETATAGFFKALFARRLWLLGNVLNAVGWGCHAAALAHGELIYVQPLLLLSVVVSLPMTAWIRGDHPGPVEWTGCFALIGGVVVFLTGARPSAPDHPPDPSAWIWTLAAIGAAAYGCVATGRRHRPATLYAIAAGLWFGLAAALTKAAVATGASFLTHWPFYGLLIATALGFYWMQRAFQSGPLAASFPVIIALDPLVGITLGLVLFGERISTAPSALTATAAGTLVTMAGIVVLSHSRFMTAPAEPLAAE